MKVKLLRQNKIDGKAGEIVDVSPARAAFLFEMNLAEPAVIPARVIPEASVPEIETPEKPAAKRTTRKTK